MKSIFNQKPRDHTKNLENIAVLVLQGSSQAAGLVKDVLKNFGFTNVMVANDGFEGVQIIKEKKIDLIMTDAELRVSNKLKAEAGTQPEQLPISGTLFTKRLRMAPSSPNPFVPIIIFMDKETKTDFAEARDAGVNEVVSKPFNAAEMCTCIMAVIDKPRIFITAEAYKGPCRRISSVSKPPVSGERRIREVRVVRYRE